MKKYFIMTDIHSFYSIMFNTLNINGFDVNNNEHYLIVCGDLFDRGDESKQLYECVKSLGRRFIYIRGNHEDLLFNCVNQIMSGEFISDHHFSNSTVKTIADLCDVDYKSLMLPRISDSVKQQVYDNIKPILDFIQETSINYFETSKYVFVHGWIPCYQWGDYYSTVYEPLDRDWHDVDEFSWTQARWVNGMKAWHDNVRIDKTIVCGHYHASYGHSRYDEHKLKEWPQKNRKNWEDSFKPFIKEGIIALDSCVAYSGFCNCLVLNEGEL